MKKLNKIFNPRSVALIGATDRKGSVGASLCKNLLEGEKKRKIFFVNPFRAKAFQKKTYPSIKDIKEKIDLVLIATPASSIPKITEEIKEKGVGGVIIISAGFAETDSEGQKLQNQIVETFNEANIPFIGPNCLGILRPSVNINASFAFTSPSQGDVAFISQSGALVGSVIDKSLLENYGFSTIISYGNGAGLNLCDFLKWLKNDSKTKSIAIYLEAVKDGQRFMEVVKEVGRVKPIVVLKAGKTKSGQEAAVGHTASLSSSHNFYSAAFRQSGALEVETVKGLFNTVKALAWQPRAKNKIAIISNSGGCGVLLADACNKFEVGLASVKKSVIDQINKSEKMDREICSNNPIDVFGDSLANRYDVVINHLLAQDNVGGLIVAQTLQAMTTVEKNVKIITRAKKKWPGKPIVTLFMGGKNISEGVRILEKNKIPNYFDPEEAALAMKALTQFK